MYWNWFCTKNTFQKQFKSLFKKSNQWINKIFSCKNLFSYLVPISGDQTCPGHTLDLSGNYSGLPWTYPGNAAVKTTITRIRFSILSLSWKSVNLEVPTDVWSERDTGIIIYKAPILKYYWRLPDIDIWGQLLLVESYYKWSNDHDCVSILVFWIVRRIPAVLVPGSDHGGPSTPRSGPGISKIDVENIFYEKDDFFSGQMIVGIIKESRIKLY